MFQLHPHQTEAIDRTRQALGSGYRRPLICIPTGGGKTVVAGQVINFARSKGKRVIFTVPKIALIDQTVDSLVRSGIRDIGVIQADHPMTDPTCSVQVASLATLRRRKIPAADLVIVDEAHEVHQSLADWMGDEAWAKVPFVGLSATPWTKGLGRFYDKLIAPITMQQLIERKLLSPFRVFAPSHPNLDGVRTTGGDFQLDQLSEVMSEKTLVADVVTTWLERGGGRPTLCFAVDRAHARKLQAEFERAGVGCGYVDAFTKPEDRKTVQAAFAAGEIRVVCNVGVLTTGVDWDVRCIILARPTKSEMLYVQIIGRGLRTAPGKDDCLILDHSDTTLRLGFVTDIRRDHLDGGTLAKSSKREAEVEEPRPKECPKCAFLRPAKVHACPACGFKPQRQSEVEAVEGELIELDGRRRAKKNREAGWPQKVEFIGALRCYANRTGKNPKWVDHKYKAAFGVWPNDPRVKYAPPLREVPRPIADWITAQNIRYAKSRNADRRAS